MSTSTTFVSNLKKVVFLATVVLFEMSHAHAVRPEFVKTDGQFVFFKSIKGGKYPWMMTCRPGINQWDMVLCGSEIEGESGLIETADELEFLVPLRHTVKYLDGCLQIDKKYWGYRDAHLAIILEAMLKSSGLMSDNEYKGTLLVDEYVAGLPMKWVLESDKELKALVAYLGKQFAARGMVAPTRKPALLIELINPNSVVSNDVNTFLTTYFDVLDPYDAEVKAFFDTAQDKLNDMMDKTKEAKNIAESMGETFMRQLESTFGDFEMKKMAILGVAAIGGGIFFNYYKDMIFKCIKMIAGIPTR